MDNKMVLGVMAYGNVKVLKLPKCYKYIYCGASSFPYDDNLVGDGIKDNTLDNISDKNKYYSELTGLYWLWKNDKSDIKGLICYRRLLIKLFPFPHYLNEKDIEKDLKKYDVILSKPKKLKGLTVGEQLLHSVSRENCEIVKNILAKKYPEISPYYDRVLNEKKLAAFNLMISSSEIFDEYCEWLFSVFNEMEKEVDQSKLTGYKTRIYGFLSERLLIAWVYYKNYRIKYRYKYNTQWRKFLILKLKRKTEKS